jgi:hypothetical protein
MSRIIHSIQSTPVSLAGTTFLPAGSRLLWIQGECDTKPTYDFTIEENVWAAGSNIQLFTKFVGMKNGARRNLSKIFPVQSTLNSTPVAKGDYMITIAAGTGVTLQVYYASGTLFV